MPNRWPITSGNWSNAAIWSGSLIPTASDDVFLNNQVVTLDQTITVRSIRNFPTGSVSAGGRIEIYSNYDISASAITATSHVSVTPVTVGPGLVTFYGTGSSTIIVANLTSSTHGPTLFNSSSGILNVIGNVAAPANGGTVSTMVINGSVGTINVVGNVTSPAGNAQNYGMINSLTGTINITGNVVGGSSNGTSPTILNSNFGTINVTGNVLGSATAVTTAQNAIFQTNIGSVNITGNVVGDRAPGISSITAGIINVIGQCIASTSSNAVSSTSTTATNVFSGPLINSGSRNAIYCYNVQMYDDVTTRYTIGVSGSNNTITLFSPDQVTGVPSGSDVRAGVIYGLGNELTGSMNVPHPNSVSWGVPVDQTSGSALAKPEDLWNVAITSLTASNSIGQRLANASTSASMAAIINAFTV
jgi:hypothetical protein